MSKSYPVLVFSNDKNRLVQTEADRFLMEAFSADGLGQPSWIPCGELSWVGVSKDLAKTAPNGHANGHTNGVSTPAKAKLAKAAPVKAKKSKAKAAAKTLRKFLKTAPKAKSGGGRRTAEELQAVTDKVFAYIKAHPGERGETIKKALGLDKAAWLTPISNLIKEKKVKGKGDRRACVYTATS